MAFSAFATPQSQQTQSLFQPQQQQQNPFQQTSPLFGQQQPQQSLFSQPQQQQLFQSQSPLQQQPPPQQTQQQQQQQQMFLFTKEKTPASYGTEWADLHPDSQKILLQIEEKILEYRDESQRLDQCSRLYDSSVSNEGFELDASYIFQELGGISTVIERQKPRLVELMAVVKDMLRNTEVAVRSFMMLQPRFIHAKSPSNGTLASQGPGAQGSSSQAAATMILPAFDFYQGLPKKPSPFLQQTIARFEKYLAECRQWVEELEQLLFLDPEKSSSSNGASLLHSLPNVISNVHDFFVHVAAKVESIHQYIESMKKAYLADQRRLGEINDPFLEADRRETAKQEAAAKRVHPTLHLTASSQPSAQFAGLLPSSATPGTTTVPQTSAVTSAAPSGSGFSFFNTPSSFASTPSMSSSLFATPSSASAHTSLFSSTAGALFASSSTPTLLASSTPSLAPSASTGVSLFSTPFGSGPATGSGASFGAPSRSTRPKSRTTRR